MRNRKRWMGAVITLCAVTVPVAALDPGALSRLDFREAVNDARARVFPAVVFIKCVRQSHESGRKEAREQSGSGVIISPDGEVLTNWHVVEKAREVRCLLLDGRPFAAHVVGDDKDLDVALLQLDPKALDGPLPHARLGASGPLQEGDFVMAMGAPWGLSRSVSIGIISCVRRFLPEQSEYSLWLQTDASISPGNSGGPLVNTAGEVVGINTLATMWGGDMGFAIPADVIRRILPRLREHGAVNWSWVGLRLQPLRDFSRNIYFEGSGGVIVAGTDPQSPARRAGVRNGDRIMRVDGETVSAVTEDDLPALQRRLGLLPVYEPVQFELRRNGALHTIELTPRTKGKVEGEALDCPRWDLTVKSINQFDNPELYFYRKQGVFVFGVKYPGNADNAGVRQGDILLKVGSRPVHNLDDVRAAHAAALANVASNARALLTVLRGGAMRQIVLKFSRDYQRD